MLYPRDVSQGPGLQELESHGARARVQIRNPVERQNRKADSSLRGGRLAKRDERPNGRHSGRNDAAFGLAAEAAQRLPNSGRPAPLKTEECDIRENLGSLGMRESASREDPSYSYRAHSYCRYNCRHISRLKSVCDSRVPGGFRARRPKENKTPVSGLKLLPPKKGNRAD